MEIKRDLYLNSLIRHMHNSMSKVITGIRNYQKLPRLFCGFIPYCSSTKIRH